MSYEGHTRVLCENGHLFVYDAYDPHELRDPKTWRCPSCRKKMAWSTSVDTTNGADPETGLCPGDVKLKVKNRHRCACPTCGNEHSCATVQYHIPKNGGHLYGRNKRR